MDTKTARIRALNDELRQNFAEGMVVMTPGIAALGAEAVARIVKTIAVFDDLRMGAVAWAMRQRPSQETLSWSKNRNSHRHCDCTLLHAGNIRGFHCRVSGA
jgi:hypothetical protein